METTDDQDGLLLVEIDLRKKRERHFSCAASRPSSGGEFRVHRFHLFSSHGERGVEPLLEGAAALEDGGQQEVQQRPELGQLVLQRRSRQEDSARSQIVGVENLRQLAVVVFHTVAFVHDHVLPADLARRQKSRGGVPRG